MLKKIAWRKISLIFLVTGLVGAQEQAFSESTVFRLFIEEGNFDNAQQKCLAEGNNTFGFTLARIASIEIFSFIVDKFGLPNLALTTISDGQNERSSIWIGMKRSPETDVETRFTEDFSFVDGIDTDRTFFETFGVLPWASSQPNNFDGGQHCVSWETKLARGPDLPLRWYDDDCSLSIPAFLCRGEIIPTALPTSSPSSAPTDSPSSSPTIAASPDEGDNLTSIIFLSVAGVSGSLLLLSLVILVRKKRDLKSLQQALHDKEKLSELALADEKEGAMY